MAAGTGGTDTFDTTGSYIFQLDATDPPSAGLTSIRVKNDAASAGSVEVVVTGLHDADVGDILAAGEEGIYRRGERQIREVHVKAVTGTATVRWGARAKSTNT